LPLDIGSNERLATQNLQIPDTAETRIIPKWIFPRTPLSRQIDLLPAIRMLYWLLPSSQKQKSNRIGMKRVWILRSGRGQLRDTGSTSAAPLAATSRSTFSRQLRPTDLSILQRDIHLIEIKYCEDTKLQNQLTCLFYFVCFKMTPFPHLMWGVVFTVCLIFELNSGSYNHQISPSLKTTNLAEAMQCHRGLTSCLLVM